MIKRREFVGAAAASLLVGCVSPQHGRIAKMEEVYGLIVQLRTAPGKRAEVIAALWQGSREMPGNIAYMIAEDIEDENAIWITEVWQTKTDHANSSQLPGVKAAIATVRPYLAGFGNRVETRPILGG